MTQHASPLATLASPAAAPPIEILRVGRFVDMHGREHAFTAADLADIAQAYDPAVGQAPLVIGHPETNGPAHGWVQSLRVEGDRLVAVPDQVEAKFAEAVNAGRYKKRSASFYPKNAKNNPTPGKTYLRHVGFLGAAVPAVTGLRDFNFAADDDCFEFALGESVRWWALGSIADLFRGLRDRLIETDGLDKANALIPVHQIDSIREAAREPSPTTTAYAAPAVTDDPITPEDTDVTERTAELAAREQALIEGQTRLAADQAAVTARAQAALRTDAVSFAEGLIQAGKLLPKDKTPVVELLLALPADDAPLSFSDGDATVESPAAALLRGLLDAMPPRIDFSEKSGAVDVAVTVDFAAPPGALVDAAQMALHAKATAYRAQHPGTSFLAAVKAVGG
ncbi:hypothetical protein [Pseudoxanthomonas sp. UTMC 1351]|uniref:hypothetical protein n=1 Tax=Pseudoxanthomonas sp. UTMC 1351 TaxID=2695853 RepID=UPI0034CF2467